MSNNRSALSLSNGQIYHLFHRLGERFQFPQANFSIHPVGALPLNQDTLVQMGAARTVTNADSRRDNIGIVYQRNAAPKPENQDIYQYHPYLDSIYLQINPHVPQIMGAVDISNVLSAIDEYLDENALCAGVSTPSADEGQQRQYLASIQSATIQQVDRVNAFFLDLTSKFDDRFATLNEQQSAARDALEKEREELREQHRNEQAALDEQRRILKDADNTHARRAIRDKISETVQNRLDNLGFRERTGIYEVLIHAAFVVAIGLLAWLAYSFAKIYSEAFASRDLKFDLGLASLTIKQVLSVVALFAFVASYIRWMNGVYQKRVSSEVQLRQTQLDIERANWIVETLLEWRKVGEDKIPDQLLTAVTRGLFDGPASANEIEISAADQLASTLLGTASKVKINTGAAELEYDGKGLRKMQAEKGAA